jgi:hypothetical protein
MAISGNTKVAQASLNNDISKPLTGFLSKPTVRQGANRNAVGTIGLKKKQTQADALGKQDSLTARQQNRQKFLNRSYGITPTKDTVMASTGPSTTTGTGVDAAQTTPAPTTTTATSTPNDTGAKEFNTTNPAQTADLAAQGWKNNPATGEQLNTSQNPVPSTVPSVSGGINLNAPVWGPGQRDYIIDPQLAPQAPVAPAPVVPVNPTPAPSGSPKEFNPTTIGGFPTGVPLTLDMINAVIPGSNGLLPAWYSGKPTNIGMPKEFLK